MLPWVCRRGRSLRVEPCPSQTGMPDRRVDRNYGVDVGWGALLPGEAFTRPPWSGGKAGTEVAYRTVKHVAASRIRRKLDLVAPGSPLWRQSVFL